MQGFIQLVFDTERIGFPINLSSYPPDVGSEDIPARLKCSEAQEAWRARVRNAISEHRFLKGHAWDSNNGFSFVGDDIALNRQLLIPRNAFAPDGSVVNPFPFDTYEAREVVIRFFVNVPVAEGFIRGIHKVNPCAGHVTVSFDPTDKTAQPRYLIDGKAALFGPLSKMIGEILKGRSPEIIHSYKLPCA